MKFLHWKGGDELASLKRPTYSQPSIMPRKQWVVVKTERMEDDDLIVVSGEEGGDEEEDEDERELELARARERSDFNISNVRSLSVELGGRVESDMDSQVTRLIPTSYRMWRSIDSLWRYVTLLQCVRSWIFILLNTRRCLCIHRSSSLCVCRWTTASHQKTTSSLKAVYWTRL